MSSSAEQTFHLAAYTAALTYILAFGVTKAASNFFAGAWSDRYGRKPFIVGGMLLQAAALAFVALGTTLAVWAFALALLGLGTAMVYPTLLAAIGDVAHPSARARTVGVYRLWRDGGFAVGALLSGIVADTYGIPAAVWTVAALTAASGLFAGARMYETRAFNPSH